ncbi:Uncaracterized surface protein containing fasciclin (FAS1) repeats [Chitinophaga sp. CF118]|uniref:fasciclin domain-containing protein n=1 Tax=Chitinophaga sp. CF118 TaxID=1884367 RepID=UPI0008DFCADE|nr:fasciclin domain-containing protein [Chitinophaga sp. CF118]SFE96634.1 Uncaracterized surface protein containing fasciclin (FAS1) repeats [Chitinophaga sp. CF118]
MPRSIIFVFLLTAIALSCKKDKWNERNRIDDPALNTNLFQMISRNPDLSQFSEYLVKTGYDKVIASSKTFTVWAPTNAALKNVDPSILNDTLQLKLLIGNHIANQSYLTTMPDPALRIRTLNGKNIIFSKSAADDANITTADQYTANGILHVIGGTLIPKMNAWEYLNSSTEGSIQRSFLQSLKYIGIDTALAEQIGVDPQTGQPIYKPGTGLVERNHFLQRTDISNEDSLLTYVILKDDAFTAEKNKLIQYFRDSTVALTDTITQWNVVKDLVFNGVYDPDNLPATLYSVRDSVKFHLEKSAIVSVHKVSNGIVYIMDHIDYAIDTKIKPIIIEGERFSDLKDRTKAYSVRTRINPISHLTFRDVYIANHGINAFWINYQTIANTVTYKVYWVAVNDFQTGTFPMKITFKDPAATGFAYKTVDLNNYNEIYLGDYTVDRYGLLNLYLVGNSVTTNGLNTLVLDYIKLVPILN